MMESDDHTLISLDNVTLRVGKRLILQGTSWEIARGQNWAVIGPNGSGKSSLIGALAGRVPVVKGKIVRRFSDDHIGYVSFSVHQQMIAREESRDEARYFSGNIENFETVEHVLGREFQPSRTRASKLKMLIDRLDIAHLMDRGIRFLSTGEFRKVLIARAFLKSPRLLILDEPFEGLDWKTKHRLKTWISDLPNDLTQLILVTHRFDEITPNLTHVLCLKNDRIFLKGKRDDILNTHHIDRLYGAVKNGTFSLQPRMGDTTVSKTEPRVLIEMKDTTVAYGDIKVFENVNWVVRSGENWAVIGGNGAGKTTLLRLISGDNLQVYANEIYLFGHLRGTGESVWEIKKRMGMISSEFQIHYRKRITVSDVVLSGFFDSIGLYRTANENQRKGAREWMERLEIMEFAERRFDRLSDGEKRLVLLARAMVKSPELLILDEPCQGLDPANRTIILNLIEQIGQNTPTSLLYVTHDETEILPCITHILRLDKGRGYLQAVAAGSVRNRNIPGDGLTPGA